MKSIVKDITLVIIGMLLVGVPVMAVSYIPSKDVSYINEYNENVTNVEEALNILTNQMKEFNTTGDSSSDDILSGKTAYANGKLLTGSMANYSGATKAASNITESGTNALITIPGGYYDANSKVSVPITTIKQLPTVSSSLANLTAWGGKNWSDSYGNAGYTITNSVGKKLLLVCTCDSRTGTPQNKLSVSNATLEGATTLSGNIVNYEMTQIFLYKITGTSSYIYFSANGGGGGIAYAVL